MKQAAAGTLVPENSAIKILLLDDEPYMLRLIGTMLEKLGFTQVKSFDNGAAALQHVAHTDNAPDLILLDLNMPGMDGLEFVRHLVNMDFKGSLILVSGEDERLLQTAESLVRAHHMTVLGTLHKMVMPQDLSRLLATWAPPNRKTSDPIVNTYSRTELHSAIHEGGLVNYYQPQVEISSGRVVGVETLVRWRHTEHGLVSPDQFISLAEELGLINDLTTRVLGDAFAQLRLWKSAGLSLRVAVNISMDNLASLDFTDFVATQAAASGVSPRDVILEVTESRLMKDLRTPLEILARLRLKKFSLSIDDFGTGHSSLSQLRDFPFDELKVDRGFVHGAARDETIRAIFDASLGLAHQLNMASVAEGVEDIADWAFVRKTPCHVAQGYFIARPMPANDFPDWITAWKKRVQDELLTTQY